MRHKRGETWTTVDYPLSPYTPRILRLLNFLNAYVFPCAIAVTTHRQVTINRSGRFFSRSYLSRIELNVFKKVIAGILEISWHCPHSWLEFLKCSVKIYSYINMWHYTLTEKEENIQKRFRLYRASSTSLGSGVGTQEGELKEERWNSSVEPDPRKSSSFSLFMTFRDKTPRSNCESSYLERG